MKTALEWFADELQEHLIAYGIEIDFSKTEAFELAKEMEKEQIMFDFTNGENSYLTPEEYYYKTYNQNK